VNCHGEFATQQIPPFAAVYDAQHNEDISTLYE
jgi:hypothetical protein